MSEGDSFFTFEKIYHFNSSVYLVKIANGNVIAITKNILLRFTLNEPFNMEEIKIPSENDLAHSLFIDPTGNHVIISMQSGQTFYLGKSNKKVRLLKEAKGILVEAIGWNFKQSSEFSTSNILIGTPNGEIIEAKLSSNMSSLDQFWNKIYIFDRAITGIAFDSYPDSNNTKWFLIITTPTSIYPIFVSAPPTATKGSPIFTQEFEKISLKGVIKCTTFPYDFGYSDLDWLYSHTAHLPAYISWMNGAGIYWASVNSNSAEADGNILLKPKLLSFSNSKQNCNPINIANTQFHIVLQYADIIDVFCIIQDEVVHTLKHDQLGKETFRGLCKDHSNGFIYTFTSLNLFRINFDGETKNLWRTYLKLGNYEMAYKYCMIDEEKVKITLKQAETLFDQKKYKESGERYALTSLSFEEATLKFIDLDNKDGLKSYLLAYAEHHKTDSKVLQNSYDVICMWLLEIFFEEINIEQFKTGNEITNKSLKESNEEYRRFVGDPHIIRSLKRNKSLIYEKIKNYGDFYQSAIFAEIIQDNLKVIEHYLEKGEIEVALKMLANEKSTKPHYTFGPKIILTHPNELVDLWIKMSNRLEPKRILPILRTIDDEITMKYVRHMIQKNDSEKLPLINAQSSGSGELHNFYVFLCAKLAHKTNKIDKNDELMTYLQRQGSNHIETMYDPQLALRICMEWKHLEGSVFLHCLLQKHREAVDLALKEGNVELAEDVALKYNGLEEVKKHLWLQIAKFIIEEYKDVEEVCNLVRIQHSLKLEDILPYFPDFVKIEDFADTICDSLRYYNEHIENLKQDMKLANEYANKTREEINFLKKRPICVARETTCAHCHEILTLRPFCLFPCRHFFHVHCLEEVAVSILIRNPNSQISSIDESLALRSSEDPILKNEYYKMISNDCCYCGSITIDIIDQRIISFQEFDDEMQHWD